MEKIMRLSPRKFTILFSLVVWFWVWGICPWNGSSADARAAEAAHAEHGHHGMDDTHHAPKGTEHSCSGSISYSSKTQNDRPHEQVVLIQCALLSADSAILLGQSDGCQRPLFERSILPKLLTEYYRLYAVYRI